MNTLPPSDKKALPTDQKKRAGKKPGESKLNSSKNETVTTEQATNPLSDFFYEELKEMYWTELHLLQVLPILNQAAFSEALKIALSEHHFQTEQHVIRLREIFTLLNKNAEQKKCFGMEGITKEVLENIDDIGVAGPLCDVAIIMGSQKAEHYEISAYGSLKQLAITLLREDIASVISLILAEEKAADELFTELATRNTNEEARTKPL